MSSGIYKITCVCGDGTRDYIGSSKHIEKRWSQHLCQLRKGGHHNSYMQRCFDKYGEDCFSLHIVELRVESVDLIGRELYWIAQLSPHFNMAIPDEGRACFTHSQETREKLSKSLTGRKCSAQHRANMSLAKRNIYKPSDEHRANISKAMTGKIRGVTDDETRRKISEAMQGHKLSPESIAKRTETRRINRELKSAKSDT